MKRPAAQSEPEPWLRGPLEGVSVLVMPLFFSFAQVREDLARHTAGLTTEQVWHSTPNQAPLGFHLRHIAQSVDRLTTYLFGEQLSGAQRAALHEESIPGASLPELLALIDVSLKSAEVRLRDLNVSEIYERRTVGRKNLPTTVLGLLVHIAEHSQRHLGQAISAAKLQRG